MGCPAGIGPEIICRLFHQEQETGARNSVVVGDIRVLQQMAHQLGMDIPVVSWSPGQAIAAGTLPVLQVRTVRSEPVCWGQPDTNTGLIMGQAVEQAVEMVTKGTASAIVTCPISKRSLQQAGYPYPGHTEMLAHLTGTPRVRMMMAGSRLKVVLVTIHIPLARVSELLTQEEVEDCISMTLAALKQDFALTAPRIAVAGLNPHSGEEGLFGDEEQRIITPAIRNFSSDLVSGPWPPDTVFFKAATGEFDAVVAMYHDQGLIPFKMLHFQDGVNVTLGLPLVRTSVDHGTAYDIAGCNRADHSSLVAAVAAAHTILDNRRQRYRA
ncbi:MAG: 4-hydroxythreonine-4-phosphate dehydrogenase PdxA [Desulfobulbus sp.]|nr:4-hydroxythreonine-4-phosphate dehydrogenase PdxA [Desulfobulbus sp.]